MSKPMLVRLLWLPPLDPGCGDIECGSCPSSWQATVTSGAVFAVGRGVTPRKAVADATIAANARGA